MSLHQNEKRILSLLLLILLVSAISFTIYTFIGTIITGLFFYYATRPIQKRTTQYIDNEHLATATAISMITLPIFFLVTYIINIALTETQLFIQQTSTESVPDPFDPNTIFSSFEGVFTKPISVLAGYGLTDLTPIASSLISYIGLIGVFFLHVFAAIVIAYYLLKDDGKLVSYVYTNYTISPSTHKFFKTVDEEFKTLYFGTILHAGITAIIGALFFNILSIIAPQSIWFPIPTLLGLLCGVASLIPVVGMKIVYFTMTAQFLYQSLIGTVADIWFVLIFFVLSLVFIDTIPDFALRPYITGDQLHMGILFLAYIFGPLFFGWYGLFLGPAIFIIIYHYTRIILPKQVNIPI